MRVGIGQDSHQLRVKSKGQRAKIAKNLILAGVEISQEYYCEADSDGDVVIHSLCNALSTAIGGGSLDTWAGEMYRRGITDSSKYLEVIKAKIKEQKSKIINVAIMVKASRPKLEEYREKMQIRLAEILEITKNRVGIAFTTGNGLTACKKGGIIEATAVVLISS